MHRVTISCRLRSLRSLRRTRLAKASRVGNLERYAAPHHHVSPLTRRVIARPCQPMAPTQRIAPLVDLLREPALARNLLDPKP